MTTDTIVANIPYTTQVEKENADGVIQLALGMAQLIVYWQLFSDEVDKRDPLMDKEIDFLDTLQTLKAQDDTMIALRESTPGLDVHEADVCFESTRVKKRAIKDSYGVDSKSLDYTACSCGGIPEGWSMHDGQLAAALATGSSGSYLAGSAKRREEASRHQKTQIVLTSQQNMKSVYTASGVMAFYQQAVGIYQGLADIWIGGFNSAGAAMGTAMGKLNTGGDGTVTMTAGGNHDISAPEYGATENIDGGTGAYGQNYENMAA